MAISKKLVITDDKIDLITTNYSNTFINNINRRGRTAIVDYDLLTDEQFKKMKQNKINLLKNKTIKKLDNLCNLNKFNYWITIHVNSQSDYSKFIDRIKKADKQLKFISLASWSMESNLHYHILIQSTLEIDTINRKMSKLNFDCKKVTNQTTLIGYLRKNIAKDIINVLSSEDLDLKHKQIEVLQSKNILSYSKNIIKPIVKKLDKDIKFADIEELQGAEYLETIEYNNLDSKIQIDKFEKG